MERPATASASASSGTRRPPPTSVSWPDWCARRPPTLDAMSCPATTPSWSAPTGASTRDATSRRRIALGVDYVEFDVQRCADGSCARTTTRSTSHRPDAVTYDEALGLLAGRARLHLDLKFTDAGEVDAIGRRPSTPRHRSSRWSRRSTTDGVRAVRDWADAAGPDLLVGLSLGRGVQRIPLLARDPGAALGALPAHALPALAAPTSSWRTTRWRGSPSRRFARRHGLPLLVWTVDTEPSLRYWLARPGLAGDHQQPRRCAASATA